MRVRISMTCFFSPEGEAVIEGKAVAVVKPRSGQRMTLRGRGANHLGRVEAMDVLQAAGQTDGRWRGTLASSSRTRAGSMYSKSSGISRQMIRLLRRCGPNLSESLER